MNEVNFSKLKRQIELLVNSHRDIFAENKMLHKKLVKLTRERASLLAKNESAAKKIKATIKRLKQEHK